MRILVTGGAGFIGSNVVDGFLADGHDVAVVDDLSAGSAANVSRRARLHRVDIRSADLDAVFASERPEVVSHHAAQVSVRRSVEEPIVDADVNVLGSLNVLEAARRHGVRRVIFASTGGAIYGDGEQVRDFVYVGDVVCANMAALGVPAAEPVVVNVGTGRGTSINALWRALAAIAQPGVGPYHEPARAGDILCSVLDPGRATAMMGWRPEVALEDGLRRTWEWFKAAAAREQEKAAV